MAARILVVDDHIEMAEMLAEALEESGFVTEALASGAAALERLEQGGIDALVTDLRMNQVGGLDLLAASKKLSPQRPVIVMTAYGAIETAVASIRQGAYHYLTKPFQAEELEIFLRRALDERDLQQEAKHLRQALRGQPGTGGLVGISQAMQEVMDLISRVAVVDVPVLLRGETGTGKSLVAEAIHARSLRHKGPFVSVNCAALPEALLESELFGHAKGSFTGASSDRPGLFAEAESGTLLLDEIGELPLSIQAKLLHVLEKGSVRPVGSNRERKVDVRILAATHRNLHEMVQHQQFREDLLYRLDVVSIDIPALRHRREDLLPLIEHFLQVFKEKFQHSPVEGFTPAALSKLLDYGWPGNVRELSHLVQRMVVLGRQPNVDLDDLPTVLRQPAREALAPFSEAVPARVMLHHYAVWALERFEGHKSRTAEALDIDIKTLNRWLQDGPPSTATPLTEEEP
ncbi:MAG TPA: sigma-54 dependent transcriptional regulator [Geothrix sp.]|nr:sigma-54 dependent transcriptional regulator [Geothrix sp.]